jgi:hypothetical protein
MYGKFNNLQKGEVGSAFFEWDEENALPPNPLIPCLFLKKIISNSTWSITSLYQIDDIQDLLVRSNIDLEENVAEKRRMM